MISGCQNWQAVMSTHLLAFLFLTRHREVMVIFFSKADLAFNLLDNIYIRQHTDIQTSPNLDLSLLM